MEGQTINLLAPYLIGFGGGATIAIVVLILYERANKLLRSDLVDMRRMLNSTLSKMMSVDYERLVEADIRAKAIGAEAWLRSQTEEYAIPEFDDTMVFDPKDFQKGVNNAE